MCFRRTCCARRRQPPVIARTSSLRKSIVGVHMHGWAVARIFHHDFHNNGILYVSKWCPSSINTRGELSVRKLLEVRSIKFKSVTDYLHFLLMKNIFLICLANLFLWTTEVKKLNSNQKSRRCMTTNIMLPLIMYYNNKSEMYSFLQEELINLLKFNKLLTEIN